VWTISTVTVGTRAVLTAAHPLGRAARRARSPHWSAALHTHGYGGTLLPPRPFPPGSRERTFHPQVVEKTSPEPGSSPLAAASPRPQDPAYLPSSTARPASPSPSGRKVSTITAVSSKYSTPSEASVAPGCGPCACPPGCTEIEP